MLILAGHVFLTPYETLWTWVDIRVRQAFIACFPPQW
jgi:hypothetical protein